MNRNFLVCAILFLPFGLSAQPIQVESQVKSVTVFPKGARVTREGSVELQLGLQSLVFQGLPAEAQEDSIRLMAEGPKGTKMLGVRLAEAFSPQALLDRRKELEATLRDLEDQKVDLGDKIGSREAEADILKNLGKDSATEVALQRGINLGALPQSLAGVGRRLAELAAANRKDGRAQRGLDEKIAAAKAELGRVSNNSRISRSVEADLELAQAGTVQLELAYQVNSASWTPVYEGRLEGEKVALGFSAELHQQTGENWEGVKLELSTARPNSATEVPDPTNWWLDYPARVFNSAGSMLSFSAPQAAPSPAGDSAPVEQEQAQTVAAEFSTAFRVRRAQDIPSDADAHRVSVAEGAYDAELLLVAVPRISQAAYIEASVKYDGAQPMLPGPVQLFREGVFVGRTRMSQLAPGESFKLGFGQDALVSVKRELMKQSTGESAFFVQGHRRYYWTTQLQNFHDGKRSIEVREQLPRSRQEDIKVSTLGLDPKPMAEDPAHPGLLKWRLDLQPKQVQKIQFQYQVKYPEDKSVTGLE